jgi:hypothetical protein
VTGFYTTAGATPRRCGRPSGAGCCGGVTAVSADRLVVEGSVRPITFHPNLEAAVGGLVWEVRGLGLVSSRRGVCFRVVPWWGYRSDGWEGLRRGGVAPVRGYLARWGTTTDPSCTPAPTPYRRFLYPLVQARTVVWRGVQRGCTTCTLKRGSHPHIAVRLARRGLLIKIGYRRYRI